MLNFSRTITNTKISIAFSGMSVQRNVRATRKGTVTTTNMASNGTNTVSARTSKKRKRSTSLSSLSTLSSVETHNITESSPKPPVPVVPKRKGKAKAVEEPKPEDYPKRVENEWKLGAHVSSAGGVENAVLNAASVRCVFC
jgi:AP endonuclease 1